MDIHSLITLLVPVLLGLAWAMWYRRDRSALPLWRRLVIVLGLCCATANFALFCRLQLYVWGAHDSVAGMMLLQTSGDIATWLCCITLVSSIAGKGSSRPLVGVLSVLGFFLWVMPAIL
jgi:hypothetical protein